MVDGAVQTVLLAISAAHYLFVIYLRIIIPGCTIIQNKTKP